MSGPVSLFGTLNGVDISYKTVERLYSDGIVRAIIHNVFILTIKKNRQKLSPDLVGGRNLILQ